MTKQNEILQRREIKFRAWDVENNKMIQSYAHVSKYGQFYTAWTSTDSEREYIPMQYTGLKDKNSKEIYEFCELNNKYRVLFKELKYVLQDISNGDIIDMEFKSRLYEITREYSPI